jgi:hypothetical protein
MQDMDAKYFKDLKKIVFDEYNRFLLMDHPFKDESKHLFNGLEESCPPPSQMSKNASSPMKERS